jgi:hypothetical protein
VTAARTRALAVVLLGVLPAAAIGEDRAIRPGDAKAYRILRDSRRLPKLDRGDAERLLAAPWPPPRHQPSERALAAREARRQLAEATCDADLVVVGRAEQASPFAHPNGRWVLTAHDVAVGQALRSKDAAMPPPRLRYLHPSGRMAVAGRVVTTTLDWFPPLATDEDLLLFLVRAGKGTAAPYRTSMRVPPLVLRGGFLRDPGASADGRRAALDGTGALTAIRAIGATVCRPPPAKPERRPSDEEWPWPGGGDVR